MGDVGRLGQVTATYFRAFEFDRETEEGTPGRDGGNDVSRRDKELRDETAVELDV